MILIRNEDCKESPDQSPALGSGQGNVQARIVVEDRTIDFKQAEDRIVVPIEHRVQGLQIAQGASRDE